MVVLSVLMRLAGGEVGTMGSLRVAGISTVISLVGEGMVLVVEIAKNL